MPAEAAITGFFPAAKHKMPQRLSDCEALPPTLVQLLDRGPPRLPHAPDLSHLLETNDPPLKSEIPLVQNAIHNCHNLVESLDAQIDDLNAQIDGLHAQITGRNIQISLARTVQLRDQTAENICKHQLIMSPVRHLPTELVCRIFFYAWAARVLKAEPRLSPTPWYLGHICRRCRDCALSFSILWSTITIHCSPSVARIAAQLLRSANAPLDVFWSGAHGNVDSRLLDVLLPHSGRWRGLWLTRIGLEPWNIGFMPSNIDLKWFKRIAGDLGQLEHLTIADPHISIPNVFSTAPNLRKVFLYHGVSPTSTEIPWHQLTHYRATGTPKDQFERLVLLSCRAPASEMIPLLQALPNLVSLALENCADDNEQGQLSLFNAMTLLGAPSDVCTGLSSLVYGYRCWESVASWGVFFAMVRSRFQPKSHLKSRLSSLRVYAMDPKRRCRGTSKQLKALRAEGLDAAHRADCVVGLSF
ncbi:hypothetical protein DFH06DRAFT_1328821 [Mycena polygramma]|nr:hypothetical protein DFH06DRAFT_1328821 [Mycena polygramma]